MSEKYISYRNGAYLRENIMKHIREHNGRYLIRKIINGNELYFGIYSSLEDACQMRDDLIAHDWSMSFFREKYVPEEGYQQCENSGRPKLDNLPRYVRRVGDKFEIVKYLDGKLRYFGRYDSLDEAVDMKERLVEHGWSSDWYRSVYRDKRFKK